MTGTSVLGITYKDGVMIAADTLGASYSLAITLYFLYVLLHVLSSS